MNNRQVALFIAASLDGYIADKKGNIDWLSIVAQPGEDYGYADFIAGVDVVIMGRKTYEKVLNMNIPFPHTGRKCYVLSATKKGSDPNVIFYEGDIESLINRIRKEKGDTIFCDGGSEVIHQLMQKKLIDVFAISVVPVLLGDGIKLFKEGAPAQNLKLKRSLYFPSGLVQSWYEKC